MDAGAKKPNERLKYQRELRGWSQRRVSVELGTNKEMISRWETGAREPGPYYQEKLCTLFGVSAIDLGFLEPPKHEQERSFFSSPSQEVLPLLTTAVSQGVVMAVRELERTDMDTVKRAMLKLLGTSLVLNGLQSNMASFLQAMMDGDRLGLYTNEITNRWRIYHKGETLHVLQGFDLWLAEIEDVVKSTSGEQKKQAQALVSLSYQLQGSLYRDRMDYPLAHNAFRKAYIAADEYNNLELQAAALARRGVTFIQQQKPLDAIQYLESATMMLAQQHFPCLQGYMYQALSEAHAMAQQKEASWASINQAEQALAQQNHAIESSHCYVNATSITAQKGVNAVLLKEYHRAVTLLNTGIAQYDPHHVRSRARLIAQKAEAYCGLGAVDQSVEAAEMAYTLASTVGSEKTIARVRSVYAAWQSIPLRKAKSVAALGALLGKTHA